MKQNKSKSNSVVHEQPRKDSKTRRVNFDNERVSKFNKAENSKRPKVTDIKQTKCGNDIRWYSRSPGLVAGSSNLTFYNVLGSNLPTAYSIAVPGVSTLRWCPYLDGVDGVAINQAAKDIYSFVVHANSRNTSYSAEDQMMFIVAGASIFAELARLIRAYGVMRKFDGMNVYLPKALITAMGFKYTDLVANYSHMWFDINRLIALSHNVWIPNDLPFVERWFWMNSNIYEDADSVKPQLYLYSSGNLLQISSNDQGTKLDYVNMGNDYNGTGATWNAAITRIENALNALLNEEFRGVIYGDILKAYGPEKIFVLNEIDLNYQTLPVYDREVLSQIENAVTFSYVPTSVVQNVDTQSIVTQWSGASDETVNQIFEYGAGTDVRILNFHQQENPTPEQIMVATRLMWTRCKAINTIENKSLYIPQDLGTEFIIKIQYWYNNGSNDSLTYRVINSCAHYTSSEYVYIRLDDQLWISFDWAPIIYDYTGIEISTPSASPVLPGRIICEFDNYTYVGTEDLKRMHTAAVFSEFGVPHQL